MEIPKETLDVEIMTSLFNVHEEEADLEKEFKRRQEHVKHTCEALHLGSPGEMTIHSKPNLLQFYINDQYHLIYCNVFKAASSSWLYIFDQLAG